MNNTSIIECKGLTKRFSGNNIALNQISFKIHTGEKVILLGANGAGKTTTLRLLLGLDEPSEGSVTLNHRNPCDLEARRNIGVTPQQSDFIDELTVMEILEFVGGHYSRTFTQQELIEFFLLNDFKNKKSTTLSLGQKRRLALALAFINKPKIVFLDEPTVGLDVESRLHIWSFIKDYISKIDITLLLTTHYLEEAEILAERVIFLQNGKILSDCSVRQFKLHLSQTRVEFKCDEVFCKEKFVDLASNIKNHENKFILYSNNSDKVVRKLIQLEIPFYNLQIYQPSLEDAYLAWQQKEALC